MEPYLAWAIPVIVVLGALLVCACFALAFVVGRLTSLVEDDSHRLWHIDEDELHIDCNEHGEPVVLSHHSAGEVYGGTYRGEPATQRALSLPLGRCEPPSPRPAPSIPDGNAARGAVPSLLPSNRIPRRPCPPLPPGTRVVLTPRLVANTHDRDFEREAATVVSLRHPRIVTVFGLCELNARPYLVRELTAMGSLPDVIYGGTAALSPADIALILRDVVEGLLFLHSTVPAPIIHGALRPQNIFIEESWRAKARPRARAPRALLSLTHSSTAPPAARPALPPACACQLV